MLEAKKGTALTGICTGRAIALERLCQEIQMLDFESKPDYAKLKCILRDLLNGALPLKNSRESNQQFCMSPPDKSLKSRNKELRKY